MEPCGRCNGVGTLTIRLGKPGQDRRVTPPSEIEWNDPVTVRCYVCLGMKVEQPKKKWPPPRTEIYWSIPLTNDERAELSTTEEPPMEAYDNE